MPNDIQGRLEISVQPVPKQAPAERVQNWDETYLGYQLEPAIVEANRCIHCPSAPCQEACPLGNDISGSLLLLEQGDVIGAANKFRETSNLPEMCGRLCPQESLCEGACVVGFAIRREPFGKQPPVSIGKLEAFVADYQRQAGGVPPPELPPASGWRVAVIGSGPAGLAVSEELAKRGHLCTVFDAWPEPGGVLLYGIPNFKMKKEILTEKLDFLRQMGVEFVCNTVIGSDITVDRLFESGYHAVFIGAGAGQGGSMGIDGEALDGVYQATEFLVRGNLGEEQLPERMRQPLEVGRHVVVVGGGDTSMDCVRTAVRLGAETVTCVYRRTESEQKGREEERRNASEEAVNFRYLATPTRFLGKNGHVTAAACQEMRLGDPDDSGRRRPEPVPGSEFTLPADTVVLAIGYSPDDLLAHNTSGLRATNGMRVRVDEEQRTTRQGVFAGGDSVNGADLVVTAVADGRRAAEAMHRYLMGLGPASA
ncbi:MAG: NADPH-dependent glutamate synthase [Dehalococcoidia bacterium]